MAKLKTFILLMSFFAGVSSFAQQKTTIYCFPGQGSDSRIFDSLKIDTSRYELKPVEYGTPEDWMDMRKFAFSLTKDIDTSKPYILMGVSLGGMICTELNEYLTPEKTIIISSAKNRNELPGRYRFLSYFPLYDMISDDMLLTGAKIMQSLVEPDSKNKQETFKSMMSEKDGIYMKRTIHLIMTWDREENTKKIYHIHGDSDHTLPLKFIENADYIIKDGSHMMTLTRGDEISEIINKILEE